MTYNLHVFVFQINNMTSKSNKVKKIIEEFTASIEERDMAIEEKEKIIGEQTQKKLHDEAIIQSLQNQIKSLKSNSSNMDDGNIWQLAPLLFELPILILMFPGK
ncbi:unnamed protein product [Rotaria socialis]|uniref:Uncharacterized protein n=1 Tax=Rotaria socialis TaxID=392032 RepID=A0A818JRJ1_9BILA|nr:unnamed protein product [Rotaria socialis]